MSLFLFQTKKFFVPDYSAAAADSPREAAAAALDDDDAAASCPWPLANTAFTWMLVYSFFHAGGLDGVGAFLPILLTDRLVPANGSQKELIDEGWFVCLLVCSILRLS